MAWKGGLIGAILQSKTAGSSKALDLPNTHRYIVNSRSNWDPWFSGTMLDSDRIDLSSHLNTFIVCD